MAWCCGGVDFYETLKIVVAVGLHRDQYTEAVGVIDEGKTSAKWPFNASENKIEDQQLLEEKSVGVV